MVEFSEAAIAFLAERRNALLCIGRGEGRPPHATPVWFRFEHGVFGISITRTRVKYRLLRESPEVSLVIDDATGYRTVIVEGRAEITDDDGSLLALSRALLAKYSERGARGRDEDVLRRLHDEERVVVTVTPERVLAWLGD